MSAETSTLPATGLRLVPVAFAAVLGLAAIVVAGHLPAHALHDAAHDMRHATGFPCH